VSGLSGLYPPAVHRVTQLGTSTPATCTYSLQTPTSITFGSAGGAIEIRFRLVSGSNCTWTARANTSWITVLDSGGTGEIRVPFTVAPNGGGLRSGRVEVRWSGPQEGQNITVNQLGQ
jgi:hypothetical protein